LRGDEDDDVRIPLVAELADTSGSSNGRVRAAPTGRGTDTADEQLARRIADGDQTALGDLYDRYGRPAYSLARRICADDGIAEDVVQEAFLAVWRAPQRFDAARGTFGSWLLTLVHHKSVDAVRARARSVDAPSRPRRTATSRRSGPALAPTRRRWEQWLQPRSVTR
jgi:DNA-directed RNA polymerase specialized sigma24 family protein